MCVTQERPYQQFPYIRQLALNASRTTTPALSHRNYRCPFTLHRYRDFYVLLCYEARRDSRAQGTRLRRQKAISFKVSPLLAHNVKGNFIVHFLFDTPLVALCPFHLRRFVPQPTPVTRYA
ncbi:hypothetical protein EVAR_103489_1 [Eumeta japonica]|uniref:Uncharacterized protein n=1 Tax=Eumeta variegata TaxID=151549 RepID=A0A4C1ZHR3_EUMVA|nr:hypothetical protein EVAR_103489_1 [Eumeta japonica]